MYQQEEEWFSAWFNSPYYHILYKNHNVSEDYAFIDKLIAHLQTKFTYQLLEMGCGNGQHAAYLNQKGFKVTGLDSLEKNIACARQFQNEHLHFYQHDMRDIFRTAYYDLILNLFTKFGYFDTETESVVALRSTVAAIKPGGKLVIDFMNTNFAIAHLTATEEKTVDGILFQISCKVENGFIVKTIAVTDQGQHHTFYERVRALTYDQFIEYFRMTSLRLVNVFGSYDLEPYEPETSERMIFILKNNVGSCMLLASIVLFFTVMVSGALVRFFPQHNQKWLKLILAFSGAYLFTLTVIHVLPDVLLEAPDPHAVGYYILAGFFLQLILEIFSQGIEHGHMHYHEKQTDTIPYLLLFSLIIHSFLEGSILIKGENQVSGHHYAGSDNFYRILAGIAIHHIPAAFALMSILVSRLQNFRKALFYLGFFALASPLGLWFSNYVLHDQIHTGTLYTILTGLVAGNFLHISTTILFETSPEHHFNRRKLVATLAGVLLSLATDWL